MRSREAIVQIKRRILAWVSIRSRDIIIGGVVAELDQIIGSVGS